MFRLSYYKRFIWFCMGILYCTSTIGQEQYKHLSDSLSEVIDLIEGDAAQVARCLDFAVGHDYLPFTMSFLKRAERLVEKSNLVKERIEVNLNYSQYYAYASNMDSAFFYINKAFEDPELSNYLSIHCDVLSTMATIESRNGDVQNSILHFLQALEIVTHPTSRANMILQSGEEELDKTTCIIHNNLGNLYINIEEYDEAVYHYDEAISIMIKLNAERFASTAMMNKGIIFQEQGKFEQALAIQKEAKEFKVKYGASPRAIAFSDLNIAINLTGLQRYDEALLLYDQVLKEFLSLDLMKGITYTYTNRGDLYNEIGNHQRALEDCKTSKKLLDENNISDYQNHTCHCLYEANKFLGRKGESLYYLEAYIDIQDSLINEKNFKKIGQLETRYKFEKANAIQEVSLAEERKRNQFITFSLAGLLTGLGLITLLIFNNYRAKSRSEKLLNEKNGIISKALKEKDVLLREIHHRVKNNLQTISSLLSLQGRYTDDPNIENAMREGKDRVKSMSLIHQDIYQKENLTGVNADQYFKKLFKNLFESYNIEPERIQLTMDIDPIHLDVDSIVPIALVVNELVSNSLKYAFPNDRKGHVQLSLKEKDEMIHLKVIDNGIGIENIAELSKGNSLGYELIEAFTQKLKAKLEIENKSGTTVALRIKNYKKVS